MKREEDSLGPQFSLLPVVFPPPEEGVNPEDPEDGDQKASHNKKDGVKNGVLFWIVVGGMGDPHYEICIRLGMALSTGLYQTRVRD